MRFSMIVQRRPISSNRKPHKNYTEYLQSQAQKHFSGQDLLSGNIYARIIWFYDGLAPRTNVDVDNISKWILDALKGIVYIDDQVIVKCITEKVDTTRVYSLSEETLPQPDLDKLTKLLDDKAVFYVLYIELDQVTSRYITFGPIDGA